MTSDPCPLCMDRGFSDADCPQCGRTSSPAVPPAAGGAEETVAPTAVSSTYPPLVEFARWAIQNSAFAGGDLCGGEVQDKAEALGLLKPIAFDPALHADPDWYDCYEFSSLLSSSPALPPAGGKGAASLRDAAPTQFAYLSIHDGVCTDICAFTDQEMLLKFISLAVRSGGHIERVPLEVARGALYQPWPPVADVAPTPSPDLGQKGSLDTINAVVGVAQAIRGEMSERGLLDRIDEDIVSELVNALAVAAVFAMPAQAVQEAQWQDISTARKDGTVIWAKLRDSFGSDSPIGVDAHLRWQGVQIPLRHCGYTASGFDLGWEVAAPVGYGGIPDAWIAGWMPLPPLPTGGL